MRYPASTTVNLERSKKILEKDATEKIGLSWSNKTTCTECCARVLFYQDVLLHRRERDGISVAYILFIELHL